MNIGTKSHARLAGIVVLLLTVVALYVPHTDITLKCDEANTLYQNANSLPSALFAYFSPNNHLLHSALLWLTTTLGGTAAVFVRFPAFAAGLLSVAMTFRLGRKFGGYRVGMAAAGLLAVNLSFAGFSVNARGYTLSILLTLIIVELVFCRPSPLSRRSRYGLLLVSAALVMVLPTMVMVIVAAGLWVLWRAVYRQDRPARLSILPLVLGTLTGGLFYLPAFLMGYIGGHIAQFGDSSPFHVLSLWADMMFGTPVNGLIFVVGCAAGLFYTLTHEGKRPLLVIAFVVFGVTALIAAGQWLLTGRLLFARNYFYLLGILALVGGLGLAHLARRLTVPLVAVLLASAFLPLQMLGESGDIDALLDRIYANLTPGDAVLVGPCWDAPVLYHMTQQGDRDRFWPSRTATERVFAVSHGQSIDTLLQLYRSQETLSACQPVDDGTWGSFETYVCTVNE